MRCVQVSMVCGISMCSVCSSSTLRLPSTWLSLTLVINSHVMICWLVSQSVDRFCFIFISSVYVCLSARWYHRPWGSNSPVWCARHCAVKCLRTWLMISLSSPKATDDPFGLPLITCVRCHVHVRTTASETEASALPVLEFGTVCRVACEHLTSATNILKHYWRHICLARPRRSVTFYISALEILLLTYFYLSVCRAILALLLLSL